MTSPSPTSDNHPIPPPELVTQWLRKERSPTELVHIFIATKSAQWGYEQRGAVNETELQKARDEELEACCEWLSVSCPSYGRELRNARRPKPPSLKEQALDSWDRLRNEAWCEEIDFDLDFIRRALESLPD